MPTLGHLRERLKLTTRVMTPVAGGTGYTPTYPDLATVWGQVRTVKGPQLLDAVNAGEGPTHRFVIRHRSDVGAQHFVEWDSRRFKIRNVEDEDGRGRWLHLLAEDLEAA